MLIYNILTILWPVLYLLTDHDCYNVKDTTNILYTHKSFMTIKSGPDFLKKKSDLSFARKKTSLNLSTSFDLKVGLKNSRQIVSF